jgi:hypothetical protein
MKRFLCAAILAAVAFTATAAATKLGYDPEADPFEQYHAAIAQAQAEGKLVLVVAGGDWCSWCHRLDSFISRNSDVNSALHDTFVVMKVYVGDENFNEMFFSQLPEARGAPHFWVISPDRNVLASQSTGMFEHGKRAYDKDAFLGFLRHWKEAPRELPAFAGTLPER